MMQYPMRVEVAHASGCCPTKAQVQHIVDDWKGERLQKLLAGHEHVRPSEFTPSIVTSARIRMIALKKLVVCHA